MSEQFDPRYKLTPRHVKNPGVEKRSRFVRTSQAESLENVQRRPDNIAFFLGQLESPKLDTDKLKVGIFCAMVPPELIRSFGAVPIRLGCGNGAMVQPGEEVLSGEICPLTKASFACFLDENSISNQVDCLIIPTACDAKKKLGEVLADFKPVFMLNLPPEQDYSRYYDFAAKELARMADFLQEVSKKKLNRRTLAAEIEKTNERTALVRKLLKIRSENPRALSFRDLLLIVQSANFGVNPDEWRVEVEKVINQTEHIKESRVSFRPRILLTGAPLIWPNFKIPALIDEAGADVVADTLCSGSQSMFDPIVMNEKWKGSLLRSLAQRYIFSSPCPCFISGATRISRVLDLIKEHKVQGVIHYGLRLCQLFDIEVYKLSSVLKKEKIPFINLRTDYSLEDTEQLRVRLEAFLETLEED